MTTTSMNQVFSMLQSNVPAQQTGGMGTSRADTAKASEFGQYMKASTASAKQESGFANPAVGSDSDKVVSTGNTMENSQSIYKNQTEDKMQEKPLEQDEVQLQETTDASTGTKSIQFGDIVVSFEFLQEIMPDNVRDTESAGEQQGLWIQLQVPEQIKEAFSQIKEKLVAKVAESFEVSQEDVETVMEQLAVSVLDFLQTDNLKDLAICVAGEESKMSLVTDESLLQKYQTMCEGVEDVFTSLTEPEAQAFHEVTQVLEKSENVIHELAQQEGTEVKQPDYAEWNGKTQITVQTLSQQVTGQTEQPIQNQLGALETVQNPEREKVQQPDSLQELQVHITEKDGLEEKSKVPELSGAAEKLLNSMKEDSITGETVPEEQVEGQEMQVQAVTEDATKKQVTEEQSGRQQGQQDKPQSKEEVQTVKTTGENATVHSNTTVQTITTDNQVQTVVRTQESSFDGIVRQIVEQIKVEFKPDTVSMELQLTPENLGKVKLHVASKEGMITAQLFVQNEAVKNAVESQLMVLRDTMQQQGIKVEAVEVAVQTGGFAENLQQNSQQRKKETENEAKSYQKKGINLLQGLDEEAMNEEELLRAHIMQGSGNSVDMNA